jgi:uncharacterized protein (DUF885 family)/ketosteroid isomerase-like protein
MNSKLLAAGLLASFVLATSHAEAPSVAELESEITRTYFSWFPEIATFYGVPESVAGTGADGRLTPRAPADETAKRAAFRQLLARLGELDAASMTRRDQRVRAVLENQLQSALAPAGVVEYGAILSDWGMWYVPYVVTQLSGPQDAVPKLLESQHAVRSGSDAEHYLARLAAYGTTIDEVIAKMEHDRKLGVVPPDFAIDKALAALGDRGSEDPAAHSLVTGLAAKAREAGLGNAEEWAVRAAELVRDVLLPANGRLAAKLESLREEAVPDAGIWRLPDGEALYQALIVHMTDTSMSPRQIHDLGLAEVARISGEMDAILRAEGYTEGSVGERMAALGEEERFLYANDAAGKQRLLADLNSQMKEIEALLPQWFGTLPQHPVVVRAIPPQAEGSSTGGYYNPPALDGSRPGIYWINLRDTAIWPSYKLKTLTYHEASPGHHLQVALGMTEDAPILFSVLFSNAFGEGWALYAEQLAYEMGLYADDPFGNLGRLQDELWRAIRLVVDTGMHSLRWSREQAIQYLVETSGTHPMEAEAEVERYAVWPGQALGYKVGMLEIQRLRQAAEAALGEHFDIRAFHDQVLEDGGVPLQLLEARVEAWIARHDTPEVAALRRRQQDFLQALAGKDLDKVTALFAEDAVVHIANMPPVEGREAIHRLYGNVFRFLSSADYLPETIRVAEGADMAYSTGRVTTVFAGEQGPVEYPGKFLLVWERRDDAWQVAAYTISNNRGEARD